MKSILVMLFMYIGMQGSFAQASATNTERMDFRVPSEQKLEKFRSDKRFQYIEEQAKEMSWWEKIIAWIGLKFAKLLSGIVRSKVLSTVMIIAIVVILLLLVLKLSGMDLKTILSKNKIDTPEIDFYTENVHQMDFDTLIKNALLNKDFRLAIRFLYLKNLKTLSDKQLIKWDETKTNYSYRYDITNAAICQKFVETTLVFDYVWYGEFFVDEQQYARLSSLMVNFNTMVSNER